MNAFLKGLVGASVLLGATVTSASAQDYVWTLFNMQYDAVRVFPSLLTAGTEHTDAEAYGTLVLTRSGSDYVLKSFSFNTTAGTTGGTAPTGYAAAYDSAIDSTHSTDAVTPFNTYLDIYDVGNEFKFHLQWASASLIDEMDTDNTGVIVPLAGGGSYEQMFPLGPGVKTRYSGTGYCIFQLELCGGQQPGYMQLSVVNVEQPPTPTPEPASMALFGAGLLGLFAARRRRAA